MLYVSKKVRASVRAATVGVALIATSASASAAYTVTNVSAALAAIGKGVTYGAVPQGINASGQVVGYYNDASANNMGSQVPFVYTPGTGAVALTQITPGFTTTATSINDGGVVVGAGTVGGNLNGFVYRASTSTFSTLNPSSVIGNGTNTATKTYLNAINSSGLAVGYVGYDSTNVGTRAYRGLIYNTTTGVATDIGSARSGPVVTGNSTTNQNVIGGVNAAGVIAGYGPNTGGVGGNDVANNTRTFFRATPSGNGGYAYTDLTPTILASVGQTYSAIGSGFLGVDALGNVAGSFASTISSSSSQGFLYNAATGSAVTIDLGSSYKATVYSFADVNGKPVVGGGASIGGVRRGFLYQNGVTTDISTALATTAGYTNYSVTEVDGINTNGDIVVTALASGSTVPTTLVIASFVPEPTSLAAVTVGGIALLRRRRVVVAG